MGTDRLMAIDPSINAAGVAHFRDGDLVSVETIRTPRRSDRVAYLVEEIDERLREWSVDLVAVEACGSWTRESTNVSSLLKLAMVTGAVVGLCHSRGVPVELVPVRAWVNGRSKSRRLRDAELLHGIHPEDDHQADSVLIGHHVLSMRKVRRT